MQISGIKFLFLHQKIKEKHINRWELYNLEKPFVKRW
jgi:hypothetical protein